MWPTLTVELPVSAIPLLWSVWVGELCQHMPKFDRSSKLSSAVATCAVDRHVLSRHLVDVVGCGVHCSVPGLGARYVLVMTRFIYEYLEMHNLHYVRVE